MIKGNDSESKELKTGNKGEWSELYVLLKVLADGKIYAADENQRKDEQHFISIISVLRQEQKNEKEYRISGKDVELYRNGDRIKSIRAVRLAEYAKRLYSGIVEGGSKGAFSLACAEEIMTDLECNMIKASSNDKTDITMKVVDGITGKRPVVSYSIKSELGKKPSLLNASGQTNFRFIVPDIPGNVIDEINNRKLTDRLEEIERYGELKFDGKLSECFSKNIKLIDSNMDRILSEAVIERYRHGKTRCSDIVTELEKKDPLICKCEGFYRNNIKKFLCDVALGMTPSKKWNGADEATGGYIIVKKNGDILSYHSDNRDRFKTYLLNNTKLDIPSQDKHKFGKVYNKNGCNYIDLNLQVRFL